ncbi:MAG: hypothetical protein ACHQNA_05750, partial [Acidimicrobiales bacterium]
AGDPWNTVSSGGQTSSYQIPDGAQPSAPAGGDADLHVIDPTHHFVDECWQMVATGPHTWTCTSHVRTDLYATGVGAGGVRAYGGSAIGGLLRVGEITSGVIPHALALALDGRQQSRSTPYVWPATASDDPSGYSGSVPMGTLVAIPPWVNVNALGLSPSGVALATALQNYGGYDVDSNNNGLGAYAETAAEGLPQLDAMRNDWVAIARQLRPVTDNSPASVGGGGVPRALIAAPLG